MPEMKLTAEDLLAGSNIIFDVIVPLKLLHPGDDTESDTPQKQEEMMIRLRPVTIGKFQLIMKAARDDIGLIPLLMIKESLVEPVLTLDQIKKLHMGLVEFLITHIRRISGLTEKKKR